MDKFEFIEGILNDGRLAVDFETGEIYSLVQRGNKGERIRLDGADLNGYIIHRLYYNGKKMQIRAHQIVWFAANGRIPNELQIDHINRNKSDNRLSNLRIVTQKENCANRDVKYGDDNPTTKIPESDKREIIELYNTSNMSMKDVAEQYGCSPSRVQQIISASRDGSSYEGRVAVGIKDRVSKLKALGNAVIPQIPMVLGLALLDAEEEWEMKRKGGL